MMGGRTMSLRVWALIVLGTVAGGLTGLLIGGGILALLGGEQDLFNWAAAGGLIGAVMVAVIAANTDDEGSDGHG